METKKIKEEKKKKKSLNVSTHTRVTSYTNKNMEETHKTKNTYLRKAAAIDRDGGSGFVPLNVPPRSSKFRFERFSKPVFRSFPNFASDLFFYLSFLWIFLFCVCKFQIYTKEDKTHSDIIALCMDQIGERIAATRSLRLVLSRLHCISSLLALRYK